MLGKNLQVKRSRLSLGCRVAAAAVVDRLPLGILWLVQAFYGDVSAALSNFHQSHPGCLLHYRG